MSHRLSPRLAPRLIPVALALVLAGPAAAQESPSLYFVDSQFGDLQTRIFRVNTATGALELRADLGSAYTPILGMAAAGKRILYLAGTDTSPSDLCQGNVACLLLRVELDPVLPTPVSVQVIGPITEEGAVRGGITGLTYRQDGELYAISQDTSGLYLLNPATAVLNQIGTVDILLHGGDITFDGDDRLWLWTNIGAGDGLYQVDPVTAHATLLDLEPYLDMAGLAAVGHGDTLQGACPVDDRFYEMDPVTGLTGVSVPMTLEGASFDHRRGDLDSPFCEEDAACADQNSCTTDECTPGGCRHPAGPDGATCDDGDACTTGDTCLTGACVGGPPPDADEDGFVSALCGGTDCDDSNPAVYPGAAQVCDGLNNNCLFPGWPALAGTNEADDDGDTLSECQGDCNDGSAAVYPGAAQVCDGLNNDCLFPGWPALAGTNEADDDGDAFSECQGDCFDGSAAVYPGAAQVCDGLNNDCLFPGWPALAGTNEADDDGDTLSECQGDCDDAVAATFPGAAETNDALDNQCPPEYGYGSVDEISGISGFTVPGDSTQFCWIVQDLATEYEVVRSGDVSFPRGCAGAYQPAVCWNDDAVPPLGSVFYYLVRSEGPHRGSWGKDSSGAERTGICPSGPH